MLLAGASLAAALLLSGAWAAGAYTSGEDLLKSHDDYRWGYLAGALDMLSSLSDAKLLKPDAFAEETARVLKCAGGKDLGEIARQYRRYLESHGDDKRNIAASDLYYALKDACKG
jgi:hypothetical protein